ncbi:MAG: hypothetical protein IIB89_02845 [Chloroflexi bacterium]|nr:hypothetical protein [Chloroflexota bacterium]
MLFLSQLYGMEASAEHQKRIAGVLRKGISLIARSQSADGGWIYTPDSGGDEGSVTITQVQAMRSCRNAGIAVPKQVIDNAMKYLDLSMRPDGGIAYRARQFGSSRPPITAAAVVCWYNAGQYDHPNASKALAYCKANIGLGADRSGVAGHYYYAHLYFSQAMYLSGEAAWVVVRGGTMTVEGQAPAALLPGSFSPVHQGHRGLAKAAGLLLDTEVGFELSVTNVDKPALEEAEIQTRLAQFADDETAVLTRAETFFKKARLFPGRTFVVGWDTAIRLVAPRYYGGSGAMMMALAEMLAAGTRFLVAGREDQGIFKTLNDVPVPQGFEALFDDLAEDQFREDISSTQLRALDKE